MGKVVLIKEYLDEKCLSMRKNEALDKMVRKFKITREEAITIYNEWRKEYLRGNRG